MIAKNARFAIIIPMNIQKLATEYIALVTYADKLLKKESGQGIKVFMKSHGFHGTKYVYDIISCDENKVKGMLVIFKNKIVISMIGVSPDLIKTLYPTKDVIKLFMSPPQVLYEVIECFIGSFLIPFSQALHQCVRDLMIQRATVTRFDFTGHSYGGMAVTVLATIYEMLFRYFHGETDDQINRFIDNFYDYNYEYLKNCEMKYSPFTAKLGCDFDTESKEDVIRKLQILDKALFMKAMVGQVHSFGAPTIYTKSMVEFYNKLMGDKHFEWHIASDILAGLGTTGNGFAAVVKFFAKGKERCPPGQVLVIDDPEEKYGHLCEEYLEAMAREEPYYQVPGCALTAKQNEVPRFMKSITMSFMRSRRYRVGFCVVLAAVCVIIILSIAGVLGIIKWLMHKN